jgi:hypothetical protein
MGRNDAHPDPDLKRRRLASCAMATRANPQTEERYT